MHELSIAYSIVESACEALRNHGQNNEIHKASRVTKISLAVGTMSGVVKDCLEFVFPEATQNTPLENCLLEIEELPLILQCRECGKREMQTDLMILCSQCHSTRVEIVQGKELKIKSLEVQ